jgi:hypothetical protein
MKTNQSRPERELRITYSLVMSIIFVFKVATGMVLELSLGWEEKE